MTSPDSLERPIVIGSVPSGNSSPAFGPEVMTSLETVLVVAVPLACGVCGAFGVGNFAGVSASVGADAEEDEAGVVVIAGVDAASAGSLRTLTPNRSARSE